MSAYILKELAFVDADDIVELPFFPNVREASRPDCLGFMSTFELGEIDVVFEVFFRPSKGLTCREWRLSRPSSGRPRRTLS